MEAIKRATATPLMTTVGVFAARAASATAAEAVPVALSPPLALTATLALTFDPLAVSTGMAVTVKV